MDQDEVKVHKLAKKERGQYPAILTEQAWSIKDLLYGIRHQKSELCSCGTKRVIPSGQDRSIFPARVANHSTGFGSPCPLTELPNNEFRYCPKVNKMGSIIGHKIDFHGVGSSERP